MTYKRINDTMPHTWIVWVYAQKVHSHITIQEMSAVRCPLLWKLPHFLLRTAKTLSYVMPDYLPDLTKLKRFFETNNTHRALYKKCCNHLDCSTARIVLKFIRFNIENLWHSFIGYNSSSNVRWSREATEGEVITIEDCWVCRMMAENSFSKTITRQKQ